MYLTINQSVSHFGKRLCMKHMSVYRVHRGYAWINTAFLFHDYANEIMSSLRWVFMEWPCSLKNQEHFFTVYPAAVMLLCLQEVLWTSSKTFVSEFLSSFDIFSLLLELVIIQSYLYKLFVWDVIFVLDNGDVKRDESLPIPFHFYYDLFIS